MGPKDFYKKYKQSRINKLREKEAAKPYIRRLKTLKKALKEINTFSNQEAVSTMRSSIETDIAKIEKAKNANDFSQLNKAIALDDNILWDDIDNHKLQYEYTEKQLKKMLIKRLNAYKKAIEKIKPYSKKYNNTTLLEYFNRHITSLEHAKNYNDYDCAKYFPLDNDDIERIADNFIAKYDEKKLEKRLTERINNLTDALKELRNYSVNSGLYHHYCKELITLEDARRNKDFSIAATFPPDDKDFESNIDKYVKIIENHWKHRLENRLKACTSAIVRIDRFSYENNRPPLYYDLKNEFNTLKNAIDNNNFSPASRLQSNDDDIKKKVTTYIRESKRREARLTNRLKACMQAFNTIESRSDKNNRPRLYYDLRNDIYKLYNCKIHKNFPPVTDFPPNDIDIQHAVDNFIQSIVPPRKESLHHKHNNIALTPQKPSDVYLNRLRENSNRRSITPDRNAPSTSQALARNHHRHQ